MEKINVLFFYQLGAQISPLTKITPEPTRRIDILIASSAATEAVGVLLQSFSAITVCRACGLEFKNATEKIFEWYFKTDPKKRNEPDYQTDALFQQMINKAKEFETVLSAELQTLETYHTTQKGAYSTTILINQAERVFSQPVLERLSPSIIEEVRQGGRCLVFDNATASGFHMLRATEAVIHEYYVSLCKPESNKKLENWGAYISALHKLADQTTTKLDTREHVKKVLALLQQIKDQDRNNIMHPEVFLSPDDAFRLFDITKTVIMAMADKLPALKKENAPEQKPLIKAKN